MFLEFINSSFIARRSPELDYYRATEYLKNCDPYRFGYFGSWQFLATYSHCVIFFLLPISSYGAYCILFQTPKFMKHSKYALLNFYIWSSLVDIYLTTLYTPYIFFPALSFFSVGLFAPLQTDPRIQLLIGQFVIAGLAVSFIVLFENRHSAVVFSRWRIDNKKIRMIYYSALYIYAFVFMLPAYFTVPDQEQALHSVLINKIVCPTPEFFEAPVFILTSANKFVMWCAGIFILSVLLQVYFFLLHCFYNLFTQNFKLSKSTRELQKSFLIKTCVQAFIPFMVVLIPASYLIWACFLTYYNQAFNNIAVLFYSFHGLLSVSALIVLNDPYRNYTKQLFGIEGTKVRPHGKISVANLSVTQVA